MKRDMMVNRSRVLRLASIKMMSFILSAILLVSFDSSGQIAKKTTEKSITVVNDGAWCWFSDPRAVYYEGAKGQLYYGWINSTGDVMIGSRDLQSGKMSEFKLHDNLEIDDHNVPSILILPDGILLAFYNEHNGNLYLRRSVRSEDISEWHEEKIIAEEDSSFNYTYTNPVRLSGEDGRIYLFGRKVGPTRSFEHWWPYYKYSDDDGMTWSEDNILLDNLGRKDPPYMKVTSDHVSRIDFVFTDGHPKIGEDVSVYHMFYKEGHFYQTNGKVISNSKASVPIAGVNKVYDGKAGGVRSWIWDIALDQQQKPVIAYARFPDENDHRYHYTRWDGERWMDVEVCRAGRSMPRLEQGDVVREAHYSGGMALDHANPSDLYISRDRLGVFEIEKVTLNLNRIRSRNWITDDSMRDNIRPYVVENSASLLMWMYGVYNHYTQYNTELKLSK